MSPSLITKFLITFYAIKLYDLDIYIYTHTIPLHEQDAKQGQFFKSNLTDLNSEFSF